MELSTTPSSIKFFISLLPTPFVFLVLYVYFSWSVDSSVSTVSSLWTGGHANGVRFPAGAEIPSPPRQTVSVIHPDRSSVGTEKSATGSYASEA